MRKVQLVIDIETEASDEELDFLVAGIEVPQLERTLGIGVDASGDQINEHIVSASWKEQS